MIDDLNTRSEEWLVSTLCHNPHFFGNYWERLDPSLFVSRQTNALFRTLRAGWGELGAGAKFSELDIARKAAETPGIDAGPLLGILLQCHGRELPAVFENELLELEDARTVYAARMIGEQLAQVRNPDGAREALAALEACIAPPQAGKHTVPMSESYEKVIQQLSDVVEGGSAAQGVLTRLPTLNQLTGGMSPGKLWIISGEISDGKSVLAQNFARQFVEQESAAAVYSWEMPDEDITRRTLADVAGVDLGIFTGDVPLTHEDHGSLMRAGNWMKQAGKRLHLVNAAPLTIYDVEADIRLKVLRDKVTCVVIDYLQLMDLADLDDNREQQVSKGCSRLYRLASSLGFTLILLSQLNDQGRLRESRAPGMDCDVSLTIQKVMKRDAQGQEVSDETRRNLFLGKNRGGRRFVTIPCLFQGAQARFLELDPHQIEEEKRRTTPAALKKWTPGAKPIR